MNKTLKVARALFFITWTYIADIPWLIFSREPKWVDAKDCGKLYCAYCGGRLFNYKTDEKNKKK